jgi:hypothetical protein
MKFRLYRAKYQPRGTDPLPGRTTREGDDFYIEIRTLEELMALQAEVGDDLIVGKEDIWIYDGYME